LAVGNSIFAYNAESFDLCGNWEAHNNPINCIIGVPGDRIWTASSDKTIKVFDAKTGDTLKTLEGHTGKVTVLLSTGRHVWSGSWDKSIILWNVESFDFECELPQIHEDSIKALSIVGCGTVWSAAGSVDKHICVWNYHPF